MVPGAIDIVLAGIHKDERIIVLKQLGTVLLLVNLFSNRNQDQHVGFVQDPCVVRRFKMMRGSWLKLSPCTKILKPCGKSEEI